MTKIATLIEELAQHIKEQVDDTQMAINAGYAKIAEIKGEIKEKNAFLGKLAEHCRDIANTIAGVAMTIDGVVEDNYDNVAMLPAYVITRTYDEQVAEDEEIDDDDELLTDDEDEDDDEDDEEVEDEDTEDDDDDDDNQLSFDDLDLDIYDKE